MPNGGNGGNVALTVQLPSGVTATSATTDRGTGCSGTTKVTCQLGSFSGAAVANITIVAGVTISQAFTTTASVTQDQADPNGGNNSASLTTTPAAPAAKVPTVAFVGASGKAHVSRLNKAVVVTGSFTVADALGVEASLVNAKTGKPVAIFAHSRIGLSLTGRTHTSVRSKLDSNTVPISIRAPHDVWVHPGRYALRINAFSTTGQSTALSVGVTK